MTRQEMIDELLERVEEELDELSNVQLEAIITEYKHLPLIAGIADDLDMVDEDDEELEEEEILLIDDEWEPDQDE